MVKNALKAVLVSFTLLIISCNIAPTYSRQDIDKSIKKICREEFDITVQAWLVQDTIWVYAPFKQVLNDSNSQFNEKTLESVRKIFLALSRVLLSMDQRPSFFAFVVSDVEKTGADLYYIGFIPDMIKMQKLFISLGQWQEREVIINSLNPKALGDYSGRHISKHNFSMGEFISYLIKQDIVKYLSSQQTKNTFHIKNLNISYSKGKLSALFDITTAEPADSAVPMEIVKNTIQKFLKIYHDYDGISEIIIADAANSKIQSYSIKAFLKEKR